MKETSAWLIPGLMSVTLPHSDDWVPFAQPHAALALANSQYFGEPLIPNIMTKLLRVENPLSNSKDLFERINKSFEPVQYQVMNQTEIDFQLAPGVKTEIIFSTQNFKLIQIVQSVYLPINDQPAVFDISATCEIEQGPKVMPEMRDTVENARIDFFIG